jgi:hypothetical protein
MDTTTPKRKRNEESDNDKTPPSASKSPLTQRIFNRVYSSIFKKRKVTTTPTNDSNSSSSNNNNNNTTNQQPKQANASTANFLTPLSSSADRDRDANINVNVQDHTGGEATGLTPKASAKFQSPNAASTTVNMNLDGNMNVNNSNNNNNSNSNISGIESTSNDELMRMTTAPFQIGSSKGGLPTATVPSSTRKKRLVPLLRKRDHMSSSNASSKGTSFTSSTKMTSTARRLKQLTPYKRNTNININMTPNANVRFNSNNASSVQKKKYNTTPFPSSLKKKRFSMKSSLLVPSAGMNSSASNSNSTASALFASESLTSSTSSRLKARRATPYKRSAIEKRHARLAQELLNDCNSIFFSQGKSGNNVGNGNGYGNENGGSKNGNGSMNHNNHDLFGPPTPSSTKKQRIQITRSIGVNQSGGSRIMRPLPSNQTSNQNTTATSNSTSTPTSKMNDITPQITSALTPGDNEPAKKSRKVTFQMTPPGQSKSTGKHQSTRMTTPQQSEDDMEDDDQNQQQMQMQQQPTTPITNTIQPFGSKPATPYHPPREINYIQYASPCVVRNNVGQLLYPVETMYGNTLNYEKTFGYSSKGVLQDETTMQVADEDYDGDSGDMLRRFSNTNAGRKKGLVSVEFGVSQKMAADVGAKSSISSKPFNFMNGKIGSGKNDGAKKGSWSVLDKPSNKLGSIATPSKLTSTLTPVADHNVTTTNSQKDTPSKPKPAASGWGNMFAMAPGEWKCPQCYVINKEKDSKCVCCDYVREVGDEGKKEPKKTESKNSTITEKGPTFSFGAPATSTSAPTAGAKFSFGAPSTTTSNTNPTSTPSIKFGVSTASDTTTKEAPKFSFGSIPSKKSDKEKKNGASESNASVGGFSFGAPSTNASTDGSSEGFQFGTTTTDSVKTESKETPASGGFSFGSAASTNASATEDKNKVSGGFSFGVSSSSANDEGESKKKRKSSSDNKISFGSIPSAATTEAKPNPEVVKPKTEGGFSFGTQTTASNSTNNGSTFKFGAINNEKKEASEPTFNATPKPAFSFGSTSSKTNATPVPAAQPSSFGSKAGPATTGSSTFNFGAGANSATNVPKAAPPAFGANSTPAPPAPPAPPASNTFSFGAGSASQEAPKPNPPAFSFGNASSTGISAPVQSFGSAAPAPAAVGNTPAFSFGATNSAAPAPSAGGFSFGGASSTPAPQFGAPATTQAPGPMSFGAAPNPGTTFGQPAAAPAPAFSFGGSAPPTNPVPFNSFGSSGGMAPAPPAAPSFGAPVNPAPMPGGGFSIGAGERKSSSKRGGRRIVRARRPPSNR